MEGKEIESEKNSENDEVDYKELFVDIFDFDISEEDTIRLSASTIKSII